MNMEISLSKQLSKRF